MLAIDFRFLFLSVAQHCGRKGRQIVLPASQVDCHWFLFVLFWLSDEICIHFYEPSIYRASTEKRSPLETHTTVICNAKQHLENAWTCKQHKKPFFGK